VNACFCNIPQSQLQHEIIHVLGRLGDATREVLELMEDHDGVARKLALEDAAADHSQPVNSGEADTRHPAVRYDDLLTQFDAGQHTTRLDAIGALYEQLKQLLHYPLADY